MTLYVNNLPRSGYYLSSATGHVDSGSGSVYFQTGNPGLAQSKPTYFPTPEDARAAGVAAGYTVQDRYWKQGVQRG